MLLIYRRLDWLSLSLSERGVSLDRSRKRTWNIRYYRLTSCTGGGHRSYRCRPGDSYRALCFATATSIGLLVRDTNGTKFRCRDTFPRLMLIVRREIPRRRDRPSSRYCFLGHKCVCVCVCVVTCGFFDK